ncbi:MAG: hypothetical protein QXU32_10565 [Nitrososphaerales archaeon]
MNNILWLSAGILLIICSLLVHEKNADAAGTMVLITDNSSTKVEVDLNKEILEPEQPVRFTIKFFNPISNQQLQHVNYSFMITDESGNVVVNRANIHNHEGADIQTVTFSNTGSFTLEVDIMGLGVNRPFDTKHSGTASTTLTVVPEFPISVLALMAGVIGIVVASTRFRSLLMK